MLIVVTYRSDDLHRTHPLRPLLAELDRLDWVTRMDLPRLARQDTGQLVAQITGREPREDLLDGPCTAGPRATRCSSRRCVGDGEPDPGLPESLRDLLLAGRAAAARRDAGAAPGRRARAGSGSGTALLAAVTGLDGAALGPRRCGPAVAANVLLTDADGYAFRHALIREAIYDELLPGERGQVHSRFAEVIAADPALVAPGRAAVEQAHHWYRGARHAPGAGQRLAGGRPGRRSALAHAEQLAMLSRVLELWEQVPDAAERIGADHVAVLEEAVRSRRTGRGGRPGDRAGPGRAEGDRPGRRAGPGRAAAARPAATLKYHLGRADHAGDLRAAVRLVPAGPPSPARARVLEALAQLHLAGARRLGQPAAPGRRRRGAGRRRGRPAMPPPRRRRWSPWPAPSRSAANVERRPGHAGRGPGDRSPGPGPSGRCCTPPSTSPTCWRARASTNWPPRWPGTASPAPGEYGLARTYRRVPGHQRGRAAGLARPLGRGQSRSSSMPWRFPRRGSTALALRLLAGDIALPPRRPGRRAGAGRRRPCGAQPGREAGATRGPVLPAAGPAGGGAVSSPKGGRRTRGTW